MNACEYCPPITAAVENGLSTITTPPETKECPKCKKRFCAKHASQIDPQFCGNVGCFDDIVVEDKTYIRTEEEYDEIKDTLIRETRKCRQIAFHGTSFTFYSDAIHKMDDAALTSYIEYHRAMVGAMEHEIVSRKIEKAKKSVGIAGSFGKYLNVKKTSEKRSKTTASPKTFNVENIVANVKASGVDFSKMSPEEIKKFFGIGAVTNGGNGAATDSSKKG